MVWRHPHWHSTVCGRLLASCIVTCITGRPDEGVVGLWSSLGPWLTGKVPQTTTSSSWALNTVVSLGTVTAGSAAEDHGGGSAHIEHNALVLSANGAGIGAAWYRHFAASITWAALFCVLCGLSSQWLYPKFSLVPLPPTLDNKATVYYGRLPISRLSVHRSFVVHLLTCILCDEISLYLVTNFNETWREYSPCVRALLKRFTRSEVKGQGRVQMCAYCNGEGIRFDSVVSRLTYCVVQYMCSFSCSRLTCSGMYVW